MISYQLQQTIPNFKGPNTVQVYFLFTQSSSWIFLCMTQRVRFFPFSNCQHSQCVALYVLDEVEARVCRIAQDILCSDLKVHASLLSTFHRTELSLLNIKEILNWGLTLWWGLRGRSEFLPWFLMVRKMCSVWYQFFPITGCRLLYILMKSNLIILLFKLFEILVFLFLFPPFYFF